MAEASRFVLWQNFIGCFEFNDYLVIHHKIGKILTNNNPAIENVNLALLIHK